MLNAMIYSGQKGAADIVGGYEQGMRIGDMIRKRKIREQQEENQKNLRGQMKNIQSDKNGVITFGEGASIGDIAQYSPETAMNIISHNNQVQRFQADQDYRNKMLKATQSKNENKPTEFQKALSKKQAESFNEDIGNMKNLDANIENIDSTIGAIKDFEKNSMLGTGPLASLTTSNPFLNKDAEALDRKFKGLQLSEMKKQFAGMSKAIDSDAERKFFEKSNASLDNRPETNMALMLGMKSAALKQRAEIKAKSDWVKRHGNLDKYESPVIGKMTAVVGPDGEMRLVNKKMAKSKFFKSLDDYAKSAFKNKENSSIDAYANNARPSVTKDDLKKWSRQQKIEELKKLRGIK